jgi:DNA-binding MarR family transcriptional regulator
MAFDTIVANPARLSILTTLAAEAGQEFVAVRRRTGLTDGNLSAHAKRLETVGLIAIEKQFRHSRPVTTYHLTPAGRAALREHANRIIDAVSPDRQVPQFSPGQPEPADWLEND